MGNADFKSVDFSKSFCTWLLQEQEGYGRFSVESILRITHDKGEDLSIQQKYLLLSKVIAGHVYGQQKLIIEPIYEFSAVFGQSEYKVFRTHFPFKPEQDNVTQIQNRFRRVESAIHPTSAILCQEAADVIEATLENRPLVAHMTYLLDNGTTAELISPIKHINVQPETNEFQVETGPVLIPPQKEMNGIHSLLQAYIVFNRFDEAEFADQACVDLAAKIGQETVKARHYRFGGKRPVQVQIAAIV